MVKEYYNRLAESLERKYASKPSKLDEAWSDTMPDWLKGRLNKLARATEGGMENRWSCAPNANIDKKYNNYPKFRKAYRDARLQGMTRDGARAKAYREMGFYPDTSEYTDARGVGWSTQSALKKNLFRQFHDNLGIDLQTAQFVETEPPKSQRHPAFNPGNIPIWYIASTNQVYAKGVNDYEQVMDRNSAYYGKAFKYVPLKTLGEMCDGAFCYIDGSSINTGTVPGKLADRKNVRDWEEVNPLLSRGEPGEQKMIYDNDTNQRISATRDKSGYYVIPTLDKYRGIIERKKALGEYMRVPEEAERTLRKYYSILRAASGMGTWQNPANTSNLYNEYTALLDSYKSFIAQLDYMVNKYGEDSEQFMDYLTSVPSSYYLNWNGPGYINNFKWWCNRLEAYTNDLERAASQFDTTALDI